MTKQALLLSAILMLVAPAAFADEDEDSDNARSQGQILHEREKTCHGLKGDALLQCRQNYVGPTETYGRDSVYGSKRGKSHGGVKPGEHRRDKPGRE